eukprot:11710697-Prorocentrum_lima.AAC.1
MTSSLVGSEMCIRDSIIQERDVDTAYRLAAPGPIAAAYAALRKQEAVSYTHLTLPTICSV